MPADSHERQTNEQTRKGKSNTSKNEKFNLQQINEIKHKIDYFITGPDMEANMVASAKKHESCMLNIVTYSCFNHMF